jgi:hypothetical protein
MSFDILPETVDWRGKGAIAPIKDHVLCGKYTNTSCLLKICMVIYAVEMVDNILETQFIVGYSREFFVVAATEGMVKLKIGTLVLLAEQEVVDCDVHCQVQGWEGGIMDDAFKFII